MGCFACNDLYFSDNSDTKKLQFYNNTVTLYNALFQTVKSLTRELLTALFLPSTRELHSSRIILTLFVVKISSYLYLDTLPIVHNRSSASPHNIVSKPQSVARAYGDHVGLRRLCLPVAVIPSNSITLGVFLITVTLH